VLARIAGLLDRVFFRPESLHPDVVFSLALAGPVVAGLILFRLAAAELLLIALAIGGTVHLVAALVKLKLNMSPALLVVMGVALCGPLSAPLWPALVAFGAAAAEPFRARFWPSARINTGVLAYAVVFLASRGAMAAYQRPGSDLVFPEPIAQWSLFYGGSAHFIEPITLYVGNVAGPVFATSLLAVAIGMAWLWYARRLSVIAAAAFLLAGIAITLALRWDPVFQLDSGPTWFVVGFALCDRRQLPEQALARPMLAVAAAVIGIGLRSAHLYIEALFLTVAAIELLYAASSSLAGLVALRVGSSRTKTTPLTSAGTESPAV
jgi:NQR2, RnfD, RnfE family